MKNIIEIDAAQFLEEAKKLAEEEARGHEISDARTHQMFQIAAAHNARLGGNTPYGFAVLERLMQHCIDTNQKFRFTHAVEIACNQDNVALLFDRILTAMSGLDTGADGYVQTWQSYNQMLVESLNMVLGGRG